MNSILFKRAAVFSLNEVQKRSLAFFHSGYFGVADYSDMRTQSSKRDT